MPPASAATHYPLAQADLCVKCGLCLPHCPTYGVTRHEGDSPRGRISLMQGMATGALERSATLDAHLDGCLGCRACEKVCPAQVPYGHLIDAGRALQAARQPSRTRLTRVMGFVLTRPLLRWLLRNALRLYVATGIRRAIHATGLLGRGRWARLETLVPGQVDTPLTSLRNIRGTHRIQLFTGCVGEVTDQATLNAVRTLCARLGITVDEPAGQNCCGALHQHAGLTEAAQRDISRNLKAFEGTAPIAFCASGCGATLKEYVTLSKDPRAATFSERTEDVNAVLARHWPAELALRPLDGLALLHLPCTQRNVVGGGDRILELLARIPHLRIEALDASGTCCGAAGSYFVTQPSMADTLLAPKLARIAEKRPDYIVSSNVGCALHLAGGLRRAGITIPVLHPAQLLAQQLA